MEGKLPMSYTKSGVRNKTAHHHSSAWTYRFHGEFHCQIHAREIVKEPLMLLEALGGADMDSKRITPTLLMAYGVKAWWTRSRPLRVMEHWKPL